MAAAGIGLLALGAYFTTGAPRLVLVNDGLRVEYPLSRGVAALVATLGTALIAAAFSRLAFRLLGVVASLGVLFVAAHLLRYRLEAGAGGLASRGVLGTTAIAWRDIVGLDRGGDLLILSGKNHERIEVDTTDFRDDQRATLARAIARRVRESGGKLTLQP